MIFAIIGGVGSGKSCSATKQIVDSENFCFANFDVKSLNCTRLKKEHIVEEVIKGYKGKDQETPIMGMAINWDYWNKQQKVHKNFNLFLDEVHNLFHSRMSGTKWNIHGTMWISQIRKILGSSESTHVYLVSQKLARIDVAFRDLLHGVIYCTKVELPGMPIKTKVWVNKKLITKLLPAVIIVRYFFLGDDCSERFADYVYGGRKCYNQKDYFVANRYFQYYDSYEKLGESAYL